MGDQNSAFVGPQNLVGYLFDGEIVVFIRENPPKIQIHASTERGSFSRGGGLKWSSALSRVKGSDGGGLPAKGHRGEKLGVKNLHAAFLAVEPAG